MSKAMTPAMRFTGFSGKWAKLRIGDVAEILTGGTPSTAVQEYWFPKEVPWLSSGEVNKGRVKFTDDFISFRGLENSNARWVKENSVLIALAGQGKTRGTVAINSIPLTTNQSIAAIVPSESLHYEFVYSNLRNRYAELRMRSSGDGTRGGLNKQIISDLNISCPSVDEQRAIGTFFSRLDSLITLNRRKTEQLTTLKQALLGKMFPRPGEKVPEIRFKGFSGEWRMVKFGDLYEKVSQKNDMTYGRSSIISVANMYFVGDANVTDDSYLLTYNVFKVGDIAFEGHGNKDFAFGRFVENYIGDGIVSHIFDVFRPTTNSHDVTYWKYAINNEFLMREVLSRCTKASTMMNNLVAGDFLKERVPVPSYQEQISIGGLFSRLDRLITLNRRKTEQLTTLKRALLAKMFV